MAIQYTDPVRDSLMGYVARILEENEAIGLTPGPLAYKIVDELRLRIPQVEAIVARRRNSEWLHLEL